MAWREADAWQPYPPPAPAERSAAQPVAAVAPERTAGEDEEAALWRRWRDGGDVAARTSLVERYMPYARALAAKLYARRGQDEVEFNDYVQFAMVGLLESVGRYAPERGARFTTFATQRIQGAVLNGLEHLTERQQQLAFRRRIAAERTGSLVPEDLAAEPSQRLLAQLEEIGVGVALGFILEGTGMVLGASEPLPEDAYAHAQLELRQVHDRLWAMVERLAGRERDIIHLHYRQSKQFAEIAETLQVSRGRISQLHRQAVVQLRSLLGNPETCDVAY